MIGLWRQLRRQGVLGLNARNGEFILPANDRRRYPLVDDKLRTKALAAAADMPVPELYGVIETEHDIGRLEVMLEPYETFVIKPAQGSGGDGIIVVAGRTRRRESAFRQVSGTLITLADLQHHVSNMLNGQFSLGGHPDRAMIEYCVRFDPVFENISHEGVPDIRVIVYRGVPVMAMVRLPTRQSGGKANLHQGAVGAGVDIPSGRTLSGVIGNEVVAEHPDTGMPVAGITVPQWDVILASSARAADITGLGYLGVDMVLDREHGPLMLELNARPGLNIQLANRRGLRRRLVRVDRALAGRGDVAARVAFACEHFAHENNV
ncbi:MAG: alpha-L-glutamate ligase-like protein [Gammaproteobacteria bacterium]|nr:alpha-L-glutamate ligase-like protein [Gammaproteobacteria bacterium]